MNSLTQLASEVFRICHLTGSFQLRSGTSSDEYFDKYRFESDPVLLKRIAVSFSALLPRNYEILAGLEMGGIPIATMLSQLTGKSARFIRKHAKEYGTCRFAEGGEVNGRHLLIVEDVITSGGQIIESVRALRDEGAIISDVVCVIDRESGGRENLAREGLALTSLFTKADFAAFQVQAVSDPLNCHDSSDEKDRPSR